MIDYEICKEDDGEWFVWTPDKTGGVLGAGFTKEAAVQDAVRSCEQFIEEMQKGKWGKDDKG